MLSTRRLGLYMENFGDYWKQIFTGQMLLPVLTAFSVKALRLNSVVRVFSEITLVMCALQFIRTRAHFTTFFIISKVP